MDNQFQGKITAAAAAGGQEGFLEEVGLGLGF